METRQTAVDWIESQLDWLSRDMGEQDRIWFFKQAKAMEKEQIKKAYKDCHDLGHIYGLDLEEYYNETYGN